MVFFCRLLIYTVLAQETAGWEVRPQMTYLESSGTLNLNSINQQPT